MKGLGLRHFLVSVLCACVVACGTPRFTDVSNLRPGDALYEQVYVGNIDLSSAFNGLTADAVAMSDIGRQLSNDELRADLRQSLTEALSANRMLVDASAQYNFVLDATLAELSFTEIRGELVADLSVNYELSNIDQTDKPLSLRVASRERGDAANTVQRAIASGAGASVGAQAAGASRSRAQAAGAAARARTLSRPPSDRQVAQAYRRTLRNAFDESALQLIRDINKHVVQIQDETSRSSK